MGLLFQENYSLQKNNTLRIEQSSLFFVEITTKDELIEAVNFSKEKNIPWMVIGSGSNLVLSKDFDGLIIFNQLKGIQLVSQDQKSTKVRVSAGEHWHSFVKYSLEQGWQGLENLALIPGTVGAAPVQNIGAYGVELCDVFEELEAWDVVENKWVVLNKKSCEFSYRDSLFKKNPGRFIITSVCFDFMADAKVRYEYQSLSEYLKEHLKNQKTEPSPREIFNAIVAIRTSKLPDPAITPNAGSFFKNPVVSLEHFNALIKEHPQLVSFSVDEQHKKLAAGWLIDQAGWKGKRRGDVGIHAQQALVLVNHGHTSGLELLAFAQEIQADIKNRYALELEIEPVVI